MKRCSKASVHPEDINIHHLPFSDSFKAIMIYYIRRTQSWWRKWKLEVKEGYRKAVVLLNWKGWVCSSTQPLVPSDVNICVHTHQAVELLDTHSRNITHPSVRRAGGGLIPLSVAAMHSWWWPHCSSCKSVDACKTFGRNWLEVNRVDFKNMLSK